MKRVLAITLAIIALLVMTITVMANSSTFWLTVEMEPVESRDGCDLNVNVRVVDGDTVLDEMEIQVSQDGEVVAVEETDYYGTHCYAAFVLTAGETYDFAFSRDGYKDKTVAYTLPKC